MPPIVSIVGRSQSGKTTLIEKLIPELVRRGYRVGTIKHTHHSVEIDQPGKDSARHRAAGAAAVMLASKASIALVKSGCGDGLDELAGYFQDVDILITEGYKRERRPKIEVVRSARGAELMCAGDPFLVAIASDMPIPGPLPVFRLDDPAGIVDFIERRILDGGRRPGASPV